MENNSSESESRPEEEMVYWEKRKEIGFWKALLLTSREVIFRPQSFFSQTFKRGSRDPLLFGTIILLAVILLSLLSYYLMTLGGLVLGDFIKGEQKEALEFFKKFITSRWFRWVLLFSPLLSLFFLYLSTLVFHIGMWLVGARKGFRASLKIMGYSAATLLISIVPDYIGVLSLFSFRLHSIGAILGLILGIIVWLGNLIATIWPWVVLNIGFKHLHKISFSRTIAGTIFSLILGVILSIILAVGAIFYGLPFMDRISEESKICKIKKDTLSTTNLMALGWQIQTIDEKGNVGRYSSIAVDEKDRIHISYYDSDNENLKYAFWNGSQWQIQTIEKERTWGDSFIVLDKNDRPHISYRLWGNKLKYGYQKGNFEWETEIIDNQGNGRRSSFALDSKGEPHISYITENNPDFVITYASKNGFEWKKLAVDKGIISINKIYNGVEYYPALKIPLALDSYGRAHMAYFDQCNLELKHSFWTSAEFKIQAVEKIPTSEGKNGIRDLEPSLALDSEGKPYIAYVTPARKLKLAFWNGSEWKIQIVDEEILGGSGAHLKLDNKGNPHIVYIGVSHSGFPGCWEVKYACWTDAGWKIETVDTQKIGWSSCMFWDVSLALDKENMPHISYYDFNKYNLKYAYKEK